MAGDNPPDDRGLALLIEIRDEIRSANRRHRASTQPVIVPEVTLVTAIGGLVGAARDIQSMLKPLLDLATGDRPGS